MRRYFQPAALVVTLVVAMITISIACTIEVEPTSSNVAPPDTGAIPTSTPAPNLRSTPVSSDDWLAVRQKTPYPYTTPLPPPTPTALDGIYVKFEPKEATPVPCRRCPDYLPEGGVWKLNLERGMYRIFHESTGWFSLGSFTLSGNQLNLFNDPTCIDTVGLYRWELADGELKLTVIADSCQVDRRGRSFANLAWASCRPPSTEAAITGHWPRPAGCGGEINR